MRLWYLSHRRPPKAHVSMIYGSRRRVRPKSDILPHWMAAHARLRNAFTEDEKYHNLMAWLKCREQTEKRTNNDNDNKPQQRHRALERSAILTYDNAKHLRTKYVLNIKSEMTSFKSNENIHKKKGGSYYVVSANKAPSVTL